MPPSPWRPHTVSEHTTSSSLPHPPLESVIEQAEGLHAQGLPAQAIALYRHWLSDSTSADAYFAHFNLGVLLADAGDLEAAQESYEACLALRPNLAQARINLAWVLDKRGQWELAIRHWTLVVALTGASEEHQLTALNHIGRVLEAQRQFAQAEAMLRQSLLRQPDQPDVLQHWLFLRMKQCRWPILQSSPNLSLHQQHTGASPLASLALHDDPALQWASARHLLERKYANLLAIRRTRPVYQNQRVRVGYLSGDLCTHAVGLLLPAVWEAHDRNQFEVFAFDYSPIDGSPHQQRLHQAVEHHVDVRDLNDAQLVQKIQACGIDVLIDLHGLSAGARPAVMAMRPATLQGVWLGFIGTTAMPWIDFVVTDRIAWPEDGERYYSESPLWVSPSFLPLEVQALPQQVAMPDRARFGLPQDAVVLACLNNVYKINPDMWSIWLDVLEAAPNSVLCVLDDNPEATAQLRRAFTKRRLKRQRLIALPRMPYDTYRAMLPLVDLYLDTYPYNAGSTACDVLSAGVPLLSMQGRTMVSRMASSLLMALGMSELVCHDLAHYRHQAIALAKSKKKRHDLRLKLSLALKRWRRRPNAASRLARSLEREWLRRLSPWRAQSAPR